ncbi:redoxin domain-containing protein [Bradyrhizobium japonicum]|uniref:redoxin domain-containing protein n=1 Tax=Bradyrhizobium japonicum TaxID=375 RepID=UPI0020134529|nr:redoxin domain-containing protein [Bradyrhizobium japonicum]
MRKSENAAEATSRPAAKPSKRDAAVAMRSATEYLIATRQAERALKAGNCAPSFRLRDQHGPEVASETLLRHSPLFFTFYTDAWCPACDRDSQAFESLPPSVKARGASLVSASQQTVAENAKARAFEAGFYDYLGPRRPDCTAVGVRWRIPKPRNVRIKPQYCLAARNLQGAEMTLFPLIMTWMWFEIFKLAMIPSLDSRRRRDLQRRGFVAKRRI